MLAYKKVTPGEMAECVAKAAEIRQKIHRYPEIGLYLPQTEKTIIEALKSFGCEDIRENATLL